MRMRDARDLAGVTQSELARRAGVSRGLVSAIELGRHVPSVDAALRLAAALGESVEALFAPEAAEIPVAAVGGGPPPGRIVRAARVGDAVVVAALGGDGESTAWGPADGTVDRGALRLFAGATAEGGLVL